MAFVKTSTLTVGSSASGATPKVGTVFNPGPASANAANAANKQKPTNINGEKAPSGSLTIKAAVSRFIFKSADSAWGIALVQVSASSLTLVQQTRPASPPSKWSANEDRQAASGLIKAVGTFATTVEGVEMEMVGEWFVDKKYGLQFKLHSTKLDGSAINEKTKPDSIKRILMSFTGVGHAVASRIVDEFGGDGKAIADDLDAGCIRIATILDGMKYINGDEVVSSINGGWQSLSIDAGVLTFLYDCGLGAALASKITTHYKNKGWNCEMIKQKIMRNPYRLIDEFKGVSFTTADKMAIQLGTKMNSVARRAAAMHFVLNKAQMDGGHTWLDRRKVYDETLKLIAQPILSIEGAEIVGGWGGVQSVGSNATDSDISQEDFQPCEGLDGYGHDGDSEEAVAACYLCDGKRVIPNTTKWANRIEVRSVKLINDVNEDEENADWEEDRKAIEKKFTIVKVVKDGEMKEAIALTSAVRNEGVIANMLLSMVRSEAASEEENEND